MANEIECWVKKRTGFCLNLRSLNLGEQLYDGYIFFKLLKSYNIVNDKNVRIPRRKVNANEALLNLTRMCPWFKIVGATHDRQFLKEVSEKNQTTCLKILFEMFLNLEGKKNIYAIVKQKEIEDYAKKKGYIISDAEHNTTIRKVKSSSVKLSYSVVHDQYKQDLQDQCKLEARLRREKIDENNKKETMKKKFLPYLPRKEEGSGDFVKLSDFIPLDEMSEEGFSKITPEDHVKNLKQKRHARLTDELKKLQLNCFILKDLWSSVLTNQDRVLDDVFLSKLQHQTEYEKNLATRLSTIHHNFKTFFEQPDWRKNEMTTQPPVEIVAPAVSEVGENESEPELTERERLLELHKTLYAENLRFKRERNAQMCDEISSELVDLAVMVSEYKNDYGVPVPRAMMNDWKELFYKQVPLFPKPDTLIYEEPLVKLEPVCDEYDDDGIKLISSEVLQPLEEEVKPEFLGSWDVQLLQDPVVQKTLNTFYVHSYLYLVGQWTIESWPELGDGTEYIDITGHNMHRLLSLKYPFPPFPSKEDLTKYRIRAILRSSNEGHYYSSLEVLLDKSKIALVKLHDALNYCLQAYQRERSIVDYGIKRRESAPKKGKSLTRKASAKRGSTKRGSTARRASAKRGSTARRASAKGGTGKRGSVARRASAKRGSTARRASAKRGSVKRGSVKRGSAPSKDDKRLSGTKGQKGGGRWSLQMTLHQDQAVQCPSVDDICRLVAHSPHALLGKLAIEAMRKGQMLHDILLGKMIVEYVKSLTGYKGFVLIDFPNNVTQAGVLEFIIGGNLPDTPFIFSEDVDAYIKMMLNPPLTVDTRLLMKFDNVFHDFINETALEVLYLPKKKDKGDKEAAEAEEAVSEVEAEKHEVEAEQEEAAPQEVSKEEDAPKPSEPKKKKKSIARKSVARKSSAKKQSMTGGKKSSMKPKKGGGKEEKKSKEAFDDTLPPMGTEPAENPFVPAPVVYDGPIQPITYDALVDLRTSKILPRPQDSDRLMPVGTSVFHKYISTFPDIPYDREKMLEQKAEYEQEKKEKARKQAEESKEKKENEEVKRDEKEKSNEGEKKEEKKEDSAGNKSRRASRRQSMATDNVNSPYNFYKELGIYVQHDNSPVSFEKVKTLARIILNETNDIDDEERKPSIEIFGQEALNIGNIFSKGRQSKRLSGLSAVSRGSTSKASKKRGSTKRGSTKRGSTKRGSTKRGSTKRGSTKRGSTKRGSVARKASAKSGGGRRSSSAQKKQPADKKSAEKKSGEKKGDKRRVSTADVEEKPKVKKAKTPKPEIRMPTPPPPARPGEPGYEFIIHPIPPELYIWLASLWEVVENVYLKNLYQVMHLLRIQQAKVTPYRNYIRSIGEAYSVEDERMEIVNSFQLMFNRVDNRTRLYPEMKSELHCRVYELYNILCQLADRKKYLLEEKRRAIMNEGWVFDHVNPLINLYLCIMQLEMDRFIDTLGILTNYYLASLQYSQCDFKYEKIMLNNLIHPKTPLSETVEGKKSSPRKPVFTEESSTDKIFLPALSAAAQTIKEVRSAVMKLIRDKNIGNELNVMLHGTKKRRFRPSLRGDTESGIIHYQDMNQRYLTDVERLKFEWETALAQEVARVQFRLKLIEARAKQHIEEILEVTRTAFTEYKSDISFIYHREINAIESLCHVIREAIEEERPIKPLLVLDKDRFYMDESGFLFPEIPPPPPTPVAEPRDVFTFSMRQLHNFVIKMTQVSPSGVIEDAFISILEDMVTYGPVSQFPYLPQAWSRLTRDEIKFVLQEAFGDFGVYDWRDFVLFNLLLPRPAIEELICLRDVYKSLDVDNLETITRKQFMDTPIWIERDLGDSAYGDLRLALAKDLIFKMFRINENEMNYTAMLLAFCKGEDSAEGFMNALTIIDHRGILEDAEKYKEELLFKIEARRVAEEVVIQLLNDVMQTAEGVVIKTVPKRFNNDLTGSVHEEYLLAEMMMLETGFGEEGGEASSKESEVTIGIHPCIRPDPTYPERYKHPKWQVCVPHDLALAILVIALRLYALSPDHHYVQLEVESELRKVYDKHGKDGYVKAHVLVESEFFKKIFARTCLFKYCDMTAFVEKYFVTKDENSLGRSL